MLSIQPLTSAEGSAKYYSATFDYYKGDALASRWLGKGSERLGLSGEVTKEKMLSLLEGELPGNKKLQNKVGKHRPGFDITLSAPKTMSILIGLGVDSELEKIHDEAVEFAFEQIEKEFAQTRIVNDGKVDYVNTDNLVIAALRHPSSRANDSNTHTHGVVMNVTLDEDGKARSLASDIHGNRGVVEQIQRNAKYCGLIYRTRVANRLKERNYPLMETGDGLFEIAGLPEELVLSHSTRSQDIKKLMENRGWEGAAGASSAALITRVEKEEHDINVLQKEWKQRAENFGFNAKEFVEKARQPQKKSFVESVKDKIVGKMYNKETLELKNAKEALDVGLEVISQKTSVFSRRELVEQALKHNLTTQEIVSLNAINKTLDEKIKQQSIYVGEDPYSKQQMLTTPWLLTLEAETISRIDSNKGKVPAISSIGYVKDNLDLHEKQSHHSLTSSQRQAITNFMTGKDRFTAIQGYAGTGKTTMLKITQDIAKQKGYVIRGLAVTSSAANELSYKTGIKSDVFPIVHSELLKGKKGEFDRTIFVADEASMLSSPQGHELIKLIDKKGGRLKLVGDDDQLPSVKNGRIFGLSQDYGIQTTKMSDIIRQDSPQLKEAVYHAIERGIYDAVDKTNEVRAFETHDERIQDVAQSWLSLSHHVRENTLVFAPTHKNRQEITTLIREELIKEGTLKEKQEIFTTLKAKNLEEIQWHYARYYAKNDVIRFNHHSRRYGITSGDYVTVDTVTDDHKKNDYLTLINEQGKKFKYRLKELPAYNSTRAGFNRHIEVYEQRDLDIAEGDKILWTRNDSKEGINNSETATIDRIFVDSQSTDENKLKVKLTLENGNEKILDRQHTALKHIDHGYVLTNMKIQGKDKRYGIGLIESYNKFSATLKNFYVQISRGVASMKIVTDDKNNLIRALEKNTDDKLSSIDFVSKKQLSAHQDKFSSAKQSISIASTIDKKQTKEAIWQEMQQEIELYRHSKEGNNLALSAKLAHKILSNDKQTRLAKSTLSYGFNTYRQDALKLETLRLKKSLSKEEQTHLATVSKYVEADNQAKKAWTHIVEHEQSEGLLNKNKAYELSRQRNKLAYEISSKIEKYKPYLAHYSIGELNRLGLPQHKYESEIAYSVTKVERLASHAAKFEIEQNVHDFFNKQSSDNLELASKIKSQSKSSHPHLIRIATESGKDVSNLWKEINHCAREFADKEFKKNLPEKSHQAFEQIKKYRMLGIEMGEMCSTVLTTLDKGESLPEITQNKLSELAKLRREIAGKAFGNEQYLPILKHFKIDNDKLARDSKKQHYRQNVTDYLTSTSNFKKKKEAAELIATDIKGHYPFIKESGVDTNHLNRYMHLFSRQNAMEKLSPAEALDYKKVVNYRRISQQASTLWKEIFTLKDKGDNPPKKIANKAFELTAKRDSLAHKLVNLNQYDFAISNEKVSVEKLQLHAKNHQIKLREIKELNEISHSLMSRLEAKEQTMSSKESNQWHKDWSDLSKHVKQIARSKTRYKEALNEYPLAIDKPKKPQKELLNRYDLNPKTMPVEPKAKIDVALTNEALMAKPEDTYKAIFGEPKQMNSREMRYSGGLVVTLKGSKSGLWYDFLEGKGGAPIDAIMHENKTSFKEAIKQAVKLAGTEPLALNTSNMTLKREHKKEDNSIELNIKSAKSIWNGTKSLANSLADKYLKEHRKIDKTDTLNMKYWPAGAKWVAANDKGILVEKTNKIPALVIPAYDEKGRITGVQRIYLDSNTGAKNTFMSNAKLSKGMIKSSAGVIQKGDNKRLFIAEGPETAASIALADKSATVLVSFGLSNINNLDKIIKKYNPEQVIIAGDNDNIAKSKTHEITQNAVVNLKNNGLNATAIFPDKIKSQKKTDWNDVLKHQGIDELRKQVNEKTNGVAGKLNGLEFLDDNKDFNVDINQLKRNNLGNISAESVKKELLSSIVLPDNQPIKPIEIDKPPVISKSGISKNEIDLGL